MVVCFDSNLLEIERLQLHIAGMPLLVCFEQGQCSDNPTQGAEHEKANNNDVKPL